MKSIKIPCLGYELAADWYEGTNNEILLVLIGYTSNKANYHEIISYICEKTGCSALVFDYSGHGESPFDLSDVRPAQNFLEVAIVFDQLRAQYPDKTINVMGTSYGGFLAVQLTKYRKFNKLILRVPAIYPPEDFYNPWSVRLDHEAEYAKNMNAYRKDVNLLEQHPLLKRALKFAGKTFVVVHDQDELVPKEVTGTYIKAFGADSYLAKGFMHSYRVDATDADKLAYKNAIVDWLKK